MPVIGPAVQGPTDPGVSIPRDVGVDGESPAPPIEQLDDARLKAEIPASKSGAVTESRSSTGSPTTDRPVPIPLTSKMAAVSAPVSKSAPPSPPSRPLPGQGLTAITTPQWDALSTWIIPELVGRQMGMDFLLRRFRSIRCTIHVTVTPPVAQPLRGRLGYAWKDADGDMKLERGEVRISIAHISSAAMEPYMTRLEQMLQASALEGIMDMCRLSSVTTRKTGPGYQMQFVPRDPAKGIKSMQWIISGDFRIDHVIQHSLKGMRNTIRYQYVKKDGRWLVTGSTVDTYGPGGGLISKQRWQNRYEKIHGVPIISSLTMSGNDPVRPGIVQWTEQCVFRRWRLVPRQE